MQYGQLEFSRHTEEPAMSMISGTGVFGLPEVLGSIACTLLAIDGSFGEAPPAGSARSRCLAL